MLRAIPLVAALFALVTSSTSLARDEVPGARHKNPGLFVVNRTANLYSRPSADAKIVAKIRQNTIVRVVDMNEQWYKIESESGKAPGWMRRSYAEPYQRGRPERGRASRGGRRFRVGTFRLTSPSYVYQSPSTDSKKLATLREGQEVRVVDKDGLWYRIESERGGKPPGYIPTEAARRVEGGADTPEPRSRRDERDPADDPNFDPRE